MLPKQFKPSVVRDPYFDTDFWKTNKDDAIATAAFVNVWFCAF